MIRGVDRWGCLTPSAPARAMPTTDIGGGGMTRSESAARYINRELSWLDFNARVLALAKDPRAAAAGAGQVPRDLRGEPGRVLPGARLGPSGAARGGRSTSDARRHDAGGAARARSAARVAALMQEVARALYAMIFVPELEKAGHPAGRLGRTRRRTARVAHGCLHRADLPGADARCRSTPRTRSPTSRACR